MKTITLINTSGKNTVSVDDWVAAHKNYLYERPVLDTDLSTLTNYECRKELAIVFPIYHSSNTDFVEVLCKSAMWQLQSFLLYSDVVEKQVSIFIVVSKKAYPIAEPYFKRANLPEFSIVRFTQNPKLRNVLKFECIFQPCFDDYEKVVWCDVDNVIVGKPDWQPLPIAQTMLERWNTRSQPFLFAKDLKHSRYQSAVARLKRENPAWHKIAEVFNMPISELHDYWYQNEMNVYDIRGWLVGISRSLRIDAGFRQWIRQWYDVLGSSDETLLELYAFHRQLQDANVCIASDFLRLYPYEQKDHDSKGSCFLVHLSQKGKK